MVLMTWLTTGMQSRRRHPLLLTLVCSPRVRKNKIRCVINRSRCPGRLLLLLESHLLNSSIKPTRCQRFDSESTIREKVSQEHPRTPAASGLTANTHCGTLSTSRDLESARIWSCTLEAVDVRESSVLLQE